MDRIFSDTIDEDEPLSGASRRPRRGAVRRMAPILTGWSAETVVTAEAEGR